MKQFLSRIGKFIYIFNNLVYFAWTASGKEFAKLSCFYTNNEDEYKEYKMYVESFERKLQKKWNPKELKKVN